MLNWGSLVRLLRRRSVLGIIFALSLTYCAVSLLSHEKLGNSFRRIHIQGDDGSVLLDNQDGADNDNIDDPSAKNLAWQLQLENGYDTANEESVDNTQSSMDVNDTVAVMQVCRNSVQGRALIVDEQGFVCPRAELLPTGCCNLTMREKSKDETNGASLVIQKRKRYSCETCNSQGCCAIYEYCVSCCLQPSRRRGKKDAKATGEKEQSPGNSKFRRSEDAIRLRIRNLDRFQICLAACRTSSASVRHENTYKDPDTKHCYSHQRHRRDENNSMQNKIDNSEVVVTSSSMF